MRTLGNRLVAPLFGLLLAASLAFGVTTTFAAPSKAPPCLNDPPHALGTCSSQEECQRKCDFYGGLPIGDCTNGCCTCAF